MTDEQMKALLSRVVAELPPKKGAMLLVFDLGEGGEMFYVCNSQRAEMVAALHELLVHLERNSDPRELIAALDATAKRLRESMQ